MLSLRRGFTLAELLVAVLLLDVGVLALAGASTVAVRRQADARRDTEARRTAANRLERLMAAPCGAVTGDSTTSAGFSEHWWVRRDRARSEIGDSLEWSVRGARHRVVMRTAGECLP